MWTGTGPCTEDAWQNCLRMTPHLHLVSAPHVLPTHFLPVAWQHRGLMPICSYCFLWQPVLCMQNYQPISYLCNFITCSFPFTWSNRMNEEASRKRRELLAITVMEMKLPLTEEVEESVRKLWKLETNPLIFNHFQRALSLGQLYRPLWKEKDVIL